MSMRTRTTFPLTGKQWSCELGLGSRFFLRAARVHTPYSRNMRTPCRQDAQLSQRDRAAGYIIVFARSRRLELEDNILQTLYVYLQPLWYNRPENLSNSVKKRKIRAITAFKVIQGHRGCTNGKPVCDFLLVINSN